MEKPNTDESKSIDFSRYPSKASERVGNSIRLMKAAKEFNVGKSTIIDFLTIIGFDIDNKPDPVLSAEMYEALLYEFDPIHTVKKWGNLQIIFLEKEFNIKMTLVKHFDNDINDRIKSGFYCDEEDNIVGLKITGKNNIDNLAYFTAFKDLKELVLRNNNITDISPLSNLTQLKILDISFNGIADISPLSNHTHLEELELSFNGINNISSLSNLTQLDILGLTNNGITDLSPLFNLTHLNYLDLNYNEISDISPLSNLSKLKFLYLNSNRITDISALSSLSQLEHLYIYDNKITDIYPLSNLTQLKKLFLFNNKIIDIIPLSNLTQLEALNLTNNEIVDISPLFELFEVNKNINLECEGNPLEKPPIEIVNEGIDAILNYFSKQDERKIPYKLPAKVLLLGNHASGKSNLLRYIVHDELIEKSNSTHVIKIEEYPKNIKKGKLPDAVFFDFGGQDYYHGLYKAFLSNNAISLLLWNSNSDNNKTRQDSEGIATQDFSVNYWIHQLHYVFHQRAENKYIDSERMSSDKEPILMIQSHADEDEQLGYKNWDKDLGVQNQFYVSLHKNIVADNKKYQAGLHYLKECLIDLILTHKKIVEEPEWYGAFINYIYQTKTGEKATPLTEISKHYKRKEEDKQHLPTELEALHKQGLILFYRGMDIAWLEPEALIAHIHTNILYKNREFENGREGIVNKVDFEGKVNDENIIQLLINQKVIFLHKEKEYIIPNYLPMATKGDSEYDLLTFGYSTPSFTLKFLNFIPFGFINQIICHFGENAKRFWRDQIVFNHKNKCNVLIKLDFTNLEILFYLSHIENIDDQEKIIKELFFETLFLYWDINISLRKIVIRAFPLIKDDKQKHLIERIKEYEEQENKLIENVNIPKDLYVSIDNNYFINVEQLNNLNDEIYINAYNIKKVEENGIESKSINFESSKEIPAYPFQSYTKNKKIKKVKKVFISYSKHDDNYKKEFVKHLVTLKDEGLIDPFNCDEIDLGENSHEVIQRKLSECDFMVALVSVDLLNTRYIRDFEIDKAEELNKKIIPIIIKPCDWETSKLGKHHASLRGTNISLDKKLFLEDGFKETTDIERAAFWVAIIKEFRAKIFKD